MRTLLTALLALPLCAAEPDLKPADTYAVIAGVLQWPAASRIPGFPTKNRKDEELHETLKARGVPAANMRLLLDEEATYSGVKRAIRAVSATAPANATLIVYYCGHGSPLPQTGELCLCNYDIQRDPLLTGLLASDLAGMVKAEFKGRRVLFLADCCFSGGLGKSAEILRAAGYESAAITSSAANVSTVNWTYTQTVIDALNGDTFADANGDGLVSLKELSDEVGAAMGALERQKSGTSFQGLKESVTISLAKPRPAAKAAKYPPGTYVLLPGGARAGRVVGLADGVCKVQVYNYTQKLTLDLAESKLAKLPDGWSDRRAAIPAAAPGVAVNEKAEIEVQWGGTWFPATVLEKDGERTKVHYVGWAATWDEWVTKDRIRPLQKRN